MATQNRIRFVRMIAASTAVGMLAGQGACLTGRQFRQAALPQIESGLDLILDGVMDGLFAAVEVEDSTSSDDTNAAE